MSHQQVRFRSAAPEKVVRGANPLADAERIMLGPKSKSVLIQGKWATPPICNDGVTIAKGFDLENAVSVASVLLLTKATMTEFEEKSENRRPGDVPM